jgi:hypothetical protein
MPRMRYFGRTGPIGVALTAWEIWRRIPKQHRRMIVRQARRHGPKVAAAVITYGRRRSQRPKDPTR